MLTFLWYWLTAVNTTLAPDGYERQVLTWNGTYPGPLIEADWGDTLVIHVTNGLEFNGYFRIELVSAFQNC